MGHLGTPLHRWLAQAICVLAFSAVTQARSETTVPSQLRELAEQQIVLGVDATAARPQLVVSDRFKRAPRALQARAIAMACAHVHRSRASATELVVVDSAGQVIETVAIRPQ